MIVGYYRTDDHHVNELHATKGWRVGVKSVARYSERGFVGYKHTQPPRRHQRQSVLKVRP